MEVFGCVGVGRLLEVEARERTPIVAGSNLTRPGAWFPALKFRLGEREISRLAVVKNLRPRTTYGFRARARVRTEDLGERSGVPPLRRARSVRPVERRERPRDDDGHERGRRRERERGAEGTARGGEGDAKGTEGREAKRNANRNGRRGRIERRARGLGRRRRARRGRRGRRNGGGGRVRPTIRRRSREASGDERGVE